MKMPQVPPDWNHTIAGMGDSRDGGRCRCGKPLPAGWMAKTCLSCYDKDHAARTRQATRLHVSRIRCKHGISVSIPCQPCYRSPGIGMPA